MVALRHAVVDFLASEVQVEEVFVETLEDIGYQGAIDMLFGESLDVKVEVETAAEKAENQARHNAIMDMVRDVQEEEEEEGVIVIDSIAMIQNSIPAEIKVKNKALAMTDRARNKRIDDQIINMFDPPVTKRRKGRKKDMRVKSSGAIRLSPSSKNKIKKVLEKMCISPKRHSNDYHRGRKRDGVIISLSIIKKQIKKWRNLK